MKPHPDQRTEAALYWSAVSLIVCEGLSIDKAAERLGVPEDEVRGVLHHRQTVMHHQAPRPFAAYYPPTHPTERLNSH